MPAPPTDTPSPPVPPSHVAARLPSPVLLRQALLASTCTVAAGQPLIRASWNRASIFPPRVNVTHRFGPPPEFKHDGGFPFHWVYAAADTMTAVWEACLCRNDVTDPGTFYLAPGAEAALICSLRFALPLTLIDLSGITLSKLGLSDDVSSPDHEAMQWFGCMLDAVIADQDCGIAGIAYPSRKQRGHQAVAISSRSIGALAPGLTVACQPFGETTACAALMLDPCRRPPPG
jgi:RES domain-containing protein